MKSKSLAVALAAVAGCPLSVSAQTTSWLDATSGDWLDALRWDSGVPGSGFDVVIDATGAAYTSTVSSSFDINDLLLDSSDATLLLAGGGVLNLGGTATISSGTLSFDAGRIVGGTLSIDPAAAVSFSSNANNALDGVSVVGDLELAGASSTLRLRNGTSVSGTILLTGNSARLGLEGTQTFSGAIAQSTGNSASVTIEGDSVVTIAGGSTVSGTRLDIGSAFVIGGQRTLINDGTVSANAANNTGVRFLSIDSLTNNGTFEALNGGRLQVLGTVDQFVNNGLFSIGAGSTGDIDVDGWQNLGQITVTDGTLNLGGMSTTAASGLNSGGITGNAGATLNLLGALDNTGETLASTVFGGTTVLSGGQLIGGTLTMANADDWTISSSGGNAFDGVSVVGDLELAGASSTLRLRNGTSVSGTILLTGNSARLGLEGTQTFSGDIAQSAGNSASVTIEGDSVVTIAGGSTVSGTRLDIGSAFAIGGQRTLINDGTVSANAANNTGVRFLSIDSLTNNGTFEALNGGRLQVLGTVDQFVNNGLFSIGAGSTGDIDVDGWQNLGQITVTDGTLNLGGMSTTAASGLNSGGITGNAGATLNLLGALDNTGETLASTVFGGTTVLSGGQLIGGTLTMANADDWTISSSGGNAFDGVSVVGDLELAGASSTLRLRNGTSVSGTILLTGNSARLGLEGTQTFSGAIAQSTGNSASVTIEGDSVVTIAGGSTVSGTRLDIGSAFVIGGQRTLINDGTVSANAANSTGVRFNAIDSLTNNGLFEAVNGATLRVLSSVDTLSNAGAIDANAGSRLFIEADQWTNAASGSITGTDADVEFGGAWENLGSVTVTNGSLDLGGSFTTAGTGFQAGRIDRTGSIVTLSGTLDNTGASLSTTDFAGLVTLAGGQAVGGTLTVADRSDLGFSSSGGNAFDGVSVVGDLELAGASSTLRLRNGTSVSGTILLTGNSARLGLEGTQTFSGAIAQSAGNSASVTIEGDSVVTIAGGSTVSGTRLDIGSAFVIGGQRTLINDGTVSANAANSTGVRFNAIDSLTNNGLFEAVNGATLRVLSSVDTLSNAGAIDANAGSRLFIEADQWTNAASGSITGTDADVEFGGAWENLGSVTVTNGSLDLGGSFTTAGTGFQAGRIDRTGSIVTLSGTLDNTGASLSTTDFAGLVTLAGGQAVGGTLTVADRSDLGFSSSGGNAFDGVSVVGDLELAGASSTLRLRNGTSVSGTILLTGNSARLGLEGTQTFSGAIAQSAGNSASVTIEGDSVVTIAGGSTVSGTRLDIGSAFVIGGQRTLINEGTVSANAANNTGVRFNAIDSLTNNGLFEAVNGGRLAVLSNVDDFTNLAGGTLTGGVYRIGADSEMDLGGPIVNNAASIELLGSNAELVGLEALESNTGSLTIGNSATLALTGGITFDAGGVFRVLMGGSGDSAVVPELSAMGTADLGGQLILDFSSYSIGSLSTGTTYTFLSAQSITGAFGSIDVLGIDPAFVLFDSGPGRFTLIPAPASAVVLGLMTITASRRRRALS